MVSAPNVVEDGLEATHLPADRPRWGWLGAGLLIGAGIAVLWLRVDPTPPATVTTTARSATDAVAGGIAEEVDGFPDGLVAAIRSDGQSLELLTWPVAGAPYERSIPVGASRPPGPVAFDVSGRRIATLLPVPDNPFGILYGGAPEIATVIDTDVTGYAWHDSDPVALSYTTFVDSELFLWVTGGYIGDPVLVAQAIGIEGQVAAWGNWGFAVQDEPRDSIVLFTDNGEIKDTHPGRALASHPTGWVAIDDDGLSMLSAGGGIRNLDIPELGSDPLAASISPDGEMLAVLTIDGLRVISLDEDVEVARSDGRPGVAQIIWSSDSRFALHPGGRGLIVTDTVEGDVRQVMSSRTFTGLGILPLSG